MKTPGASLGTEGPGPNATSGRGLIQSHKTRRSRRLIPAGETRQALDRSPRFFFSKAATIQGSGMIFDREIGNLIGELFYSDEERQKEIFNQLCELWDGNRSAVHRLGDVRASLRKLRRALEKKAAAPMFEVRVSALNGLTEPGNFRAEKTKAWDFRPGTVSYGETTFPLTGKKWELLKLLVEADGEPVYPDLIIQKIWIDGGEEAEPETLRTHFSHLRRVLRDAFGLEKTSDPIPHCDTGPRKGWRLAIEMFNGSTRDF